VDPFKIVLFIAAFVVLLVIGRMLSRVSEVHAASLPHSGLPDQRTPFVNTPVDDIGTRSPAVVGSEIAFPIHLASVVEHNDGSFNRPYILNYYFEKTDLLRGPEITDSLFDRLTIETSDPATGHQVNYSYTVATPAGLRRAMDEEKLSSLYLDFLPVVIVPSWKLDLILQTVVDEMIKTYGGHEDSETESTDNLNS
jgi:hypothetical protein